MYVYVLQHQLENHTGDFCCTVQGFQYADDDDLHWPYMQFKVGPPSHVAPQHKHLSYQSLSGTSAPDMPPLTGHMKF